MYNILVDSEYLEISSKAKIQLNKTLFNLSDISERGLRFTNAITIPVTNTNNRLLGYPSKIDSNNKAFEKTKPYTLVDQFGIISRGDLVVKSYSKNKGIKIQMAEGFEFWAEAGRRTLKDLVIHDQDFVFNSTNMDALKIKGTSVFLTALHSATGGSSGTALTDYTKTRPCYRFDRVLDKIVTELGYTADYDDIYSVTNLNLIGCLSNTKEFYISDFKRRFQNANLGAGNIDISAASSIFAKSGNVSLSTDTLTNNLYKTSYIIKGWVESTVSTQILFTFGSTIERILIPSGRSFVNFRSDEVEIGSTLVLSLQEPVSFEDVYVYSCIAETDLFEITGTISVNDYLVLSDYNLPEQTCKQFIKNMFKIGFLESTINEAKKEIKFSYLPGKISTNNTVDLSRNVSINPGFSTNSVYAQLNMMTYSNDEDVNINLGTAFFFVDNSSAEDSKIFLSINEFSASNEITVSSENIIVCSIYDTTENKRSSIKDRIVYFNETGSFGFNATFNAISFQRIFSDVYSSFVEATKRERVVNITAFLTKLQFNELDRSPVVYIEDLKGHYLVNSIKGFDQKGNAQLSTIKYN